jgi:hypothetical protein
MLFNEITAKLKYSEHALDCYNTIFVSVINNYSSDAYTECPIISESPLECR